MRTRVIPALLLYEESLVKTVKFSEINYVGDPINTVRIFNELEVDELLFLDIESGKKNSPINFKLLEKIACECFMPLAYGGGINNINDAKRLFNIGFEKVCINTALHKDPELIFKISEIYGSQSIIASIDYKKNFFGSKIVYSSGGQKKENPSIIDLAIKAEKMGAGELLLTAIDRDGTWIGYDLETIKEISLNVSIPVIANGGAGCLDHLISAVRIGGASALGVGSMVVYQKQGMGVLINFPDKNSLKKIDTL